MIRQQCPKEVGNQQTECWKQRRQEKLWKKVSSFVLFPASQLPNPFGPASSLPCFLHTGTCASGFTCVCLTDIPIRYTKTSSSTRPELCPPDLSHLWPPVNPRSIRSTPVTLGRNENNSGRAWQDYEIRDDDQLCVVDVSLLRTGGLHA